MNARAKTQRERESPDSWESSLNFVWMKLSGSTQPLEPDLLMSSSQHTFSIFTFCFENIGDR